MLVWMDAKTFLNEYLEKETDYDILEAYYVIVSMRIHHRDTSIHTVAKLNDYYYPDAEVLYRNNSKDIRWAYWNQLKSRCNPHLATLIQGSVKKGYNIVFLCTPAEKDMHYLQYLAQYVMEEFQYPMYNYKDFINPKKPLYKYDPDKVLAKCKLILDNARQERMKKETPGSRKSRISKMSKKQLKKELEKLGYIVTDESKSEMIDVLIES